MNREQFIATPEDKLVTVRIVSGDGAEVPFNRLLNTILATDGASFQALEQDLAGATEGMTVKLPESKRATIKSITAGSAGVSMVALQADPPPQADVADAKATPTKVGTTKPADTSTEVAGK
jgi:hypothetical protein